MSSSEQNKRLEGRCYERSCDDIALVAERHFSPGENSKWFTPTTIRFRWLVQNRDSMTINAQTRWRSNFRSWRSLVMFAALATLLTLVCGQCLLEPFTETLHLCHPWPGRTGFPMLSPRRKVLHWCWRDKIKQETFFSGCGLVHCVR